MEKKCKTCDAYCAIYGKFAFGYCKTVNLRYCAAKEEMVDDNHVCDNWRKKRRAEVDLSKERFDEVERDILFIKDNVKFLK